MGPMKSILGEALARHEDEKGKEAPSKSGASWKGSGDDDDIQKIVDSLNVSIKIIGCGGGGSNTVNRCTEAGITGAQLAAVNTDAKHLLAVHAPKKILLGKRLTKGLGAGALPEVGEQAAKESEEEIRESIKGITEIITKPGLVNLDYADLMTIMKGGGVAMIGLGESDADRDRIEEALNEGLSSPLLGEVDLSHARGCLVRVVGGPDLTVSEAERAAALVSEKINPQARLIWCCSVDPDLEKTVQVLLVVTGVKNKSLLGKEHTPTPVAREVDEVR